MVKAGDYLSGRDLQDYLEKHAEGNCPFCGAYEVEWDHPEWTADGIDGAASCGACGAQWVEVCIVNTVYIIQEPEEVEDVQSASEGDSEGTADSG